MESLCLPRHGGKAIAHIPYSPTDSWPTGQTLPAANNLSFYEGHAATIGLEKLWFHVGTGTIFRARETGCHNEENASARENAFGGTPQHVTNRFSSLIARRRDLQFGCANSRPRTLLK
jgi:hypothetical protein